MDWFGTAGIRGNATTFATPELALAVGRAAGYDARSNTTTPSFVVGRDGRVTGPGLAAAVMAGLQSMGVPVQNAGQVPTPALAFASRGQRGIMITASHNPPADNGFKLFCNGVEYDHSAERRIERLLDESPTAVSWNDWTTVTSVSVISNYCQAVVRYAAQWGESLAETRVAVDCGNGMAGLATPTVLRELGADVSALHANIDGHFSARESKPTTASLTTFSQYLAESDFDFGIAHDGDADRVVIVASDGSIVHEDTVLAILAEAAVTSSRVADPIVVTTPNASSRIDERVTAAGGRVERVQLGALHEGISRVNSNESAESRVAYAAEPWKHIHPSFGGWIDGIATAAVFARLVAAAGDLATLREPIPEPPYRKASLECPDDAKASAMETIKETLPAAFSAGTVDTDYGVRIDLPDGSWVLVRSSGTEPHIRLYVESEEIDTLLESVREVVASAIAEASNRQ